MFIYNIAISGYIMGYSGRGEGSNRGFNDRNSDRNFGPKPVEEGKEYDLEITEISRQGDGIAKVQGFIVFVKGGQTGQKVKVKVTKVGSRFAIGEPVKGQDNDNPIKDELEQQWSNENYTGESLGDKQSSEE
jgi:predicted RNA-binding protein with TRAM domain